MSTHAPGHPWSSLDAVETGLHDRGTTPGPRRQFAPAVGAPLPDPAERRIYPPPGLSRHAHLCRYDASTEWSFQAACLAGKIRSKLASSHQEAPELLPVATEAASGRFGRERATPDLVLGMEEVRGSIPLRSTPKHHFEDSDGVLLRVVSRSSTG